AELNTPLLGSLRFSKGGFSALGEFLPWDPIFHNTAAVNAMGAFMTFRGERTSTENKERLSQQEGNHVWYWKSTQCQRSYGFVGGEPTATNLLNQHNP
ncbi:hypothetical protein LEMLEM_LOCUS26401, partial [Lemmus lemmus]